MHVDEALRTRISIRAFRSDPVDRELVRDVLDTARWSPSGGNLQPWKVIVVAGDARDEVISIAERVMSEQPGGEGDEIPVYPPNLPEPYRTRRYSLGEEMYELLGIPREDRAGRLARLAENMRFFGAPVGLFFVIDRIMGKGQWAHLGMFMQSVALAAEARGLGTCMQEYWGTVRRSLHDHFDLDEGELLYCGMAMGWPDRDHPVNALRSSRAEVDEFTTWRGF